MSEGKRLPTIAAYALPTEAELPAPRPDWRLAADRAALLIHDMQAYFVGAFEPDAQPMARAIPNMARLIERCRTLGAPVVYTAQHGAQDPRDRGLQADFWGPGMRAIPEHETIVGALTPQAADLRLVKHRYSAFQRSNLAELMRARGRDQLIVCGVYAHIGCALTAGEAFQRDIQPFLVADALGDFSREKHDLALAQVGSCCGVVRSTRQVLEALS